MFNKHLFCTFQHVKGEVYEIDNKMLDFCDDFEWHPNVYTRDLIKVELVHELSSPSEQVSHLETKDKDKDTEKTYTECWCYFLKKISPKVRHLPPMEEYSQLNHETYSEE